MSVRVYVRMSKIMHMPIKVGVRTYAAHAICQTLIAYKIWEKVKKKL